MSIPNLPAMFISETTGWGELARLHPPVTKLFLRLVVPMSIVPPVMYAYSELIHPGRVFPLSVPALTATQLLVSGAVLFAVQLAMVSFMAMLIRRMCMARDHDPAFEEAYALAAVAPVPLWLSSLALFVPSLWFNVGVVTLAWIASLALIRHGVRPLLGVRDAQKAHYISNLVSLAGVGAWIALLIVSGEILSLLLG